MPVLVAGIMLMNADGGDQAGRQHNQLIKVWRGQTMQHAERHDRDLVVDVLWKSQPVENCKSVGDVDSCRVQTPSCMVNKYYSYRVFIRVFRDEYCPGQNAKGQNVSH